MHKIILEVQNTFYQVQQRWNTASIPWDTQKSLCEITKVYKWNTQNFSVNVQNLSILVPRPVIFSA